MTFNKYRYKCCTIKYSTKDEAEWQIQHKKNTVLLMRFVELRGRIVSVIL